MIECLQVRTQPFCRSAAGVKIGMSLQPSLTRHLHDTLPALNHSLLRIMREIKKNIDLME
jgi:hypothetical protein